MSNLFKADQHFLNFSLNLRVKKRNESDFEIFKQTQLEAWKRNQKSLSKTFKFNFKKNLKKVESFHKFHSN
jgi:hypothetical protein